MSGGILQLCASGLTDVFLCGDPQVTFFKTIYRRYTNFSKTELDLSFANNLDFGKQGYARIERYGDLLHRLFLVVTLPQINIVYSSLTVAQVQKLLLAYQITWTTTLPPDSIFNQAAYNQVEPLVEQKINELNAEITLLNTLIGLLQPNQPLYYQNWIAANPGGTAQEYYNAVLQEFFNFDPYNIEYKVIVAQTEDTAFHQLPLANSNTVQSIMLSDFLTFATEANLYPNSFEPANVQFYYNTQIANYSLNVGGLTTVDSSTVFRSAVAQIYGSIPYMGLDAYKIFNVILEQNQTIITSNAQIQSILQILLDNIRYGLIDNDKLQYGIYQSLSDTAKFIFYKKFPVIGVGSGVYNTAGQFVNNSTSQPQTGNLNDNWTQDFTIAPEPSQPSDVDHPFSNAVSAFISSFNTTNQNLFQTSNFINYFNNLTLWKNTNVSGSIYTPSTITTVQANMYFMNYIWFLTNNDIAASIINYLQNNNLKQSASTISGLTTALNNLLNANLAIISPKITNTDNYDTLNTLSSTVKTNTGPNGDIVTAAIIRPGDVNSIVVTGSGPILIPDYIISTYLNLISTFQTPSPAQQNNYNTNAMPGHCYK